jgi:general secretion pathway protein A
LYEAYWNFSTLPFQNVPDPNEYFPSVTHEEAVKRIIYAITGEKGGILLTGDIGTGKTVISRTVVARLTGKDIDIGIMTNPALNREDLLREILYQLGMSSPSSNKLDLIHEINDKRLLLNFQLNDRFLLTLILVGQPELKKIIHNVPALEQRLTIKFHLRSFNLEETGAYIIYRLKHAGAKHPIFTIDALKLIYQYTEGVPRRINQVCDLSLLIGYFKKSERVDTTIIKKVIADEQQQMV